MAEIIEIEAGGVVYDIKDKNAVPKPSTTGTEGQVLANDGNGGTRWADPQVTPGTSFNIHALQTENALADSDELPLYDNSASAQRKTSWANIIAKITTALSAAFAAVSHSHTTSDISNFPAIPTELSDLQDDTSHRTVSDLEKSGWNAKGSYSKPSGGIPASDMDASVQNMLQKANTALQNHQSLSAYRTSNAQDIIDETKAPKTHGLNTEDAIGDADELAYYDDSAGADKKTTWSNIVSKISTALGSVFAALSHTHTTSDITDFPTIPDVSGKADKVSGSHTNEIAILDSGGNLQAGGKTLSDLQDKIDESHKLSYNLLSDTPTIPAAPSDMTGATSGAAGAHGLVPAPSAGDNEKFLAGDGTWKTVQGGSANTPVVTTMPQAGMEAGKLYVMDYSSESAVTLLLQAGASGVENVYRINFTTGSTAPTITWPSGITWCGGSAPTISASKTYEVNISDDGTHKLALACEY